MSQRIADPTIQDFQTEESIQAWLISQLAERLEIVPDEIDIQSSFESYALESAEALVLLSKLEKHLGRSLSPTLLWNYPTIEALAQRLAEDDEASESGI
jgi:acyl carrier protein